MKPKVYLETSVLSYWTAPPSRDARVAAFQQATHEWFSAKHAAFDLFVSDLVAEEVSAGDASYAQARLKSGTLCVRSWLRPWNFWETEMLNDPIVEEVRKARAAFAARYGNDINAMCDALARRKDSAAAYVMFAPKRITASARGRTARKRVSATK